MKFTWDTEVEQIDFALSQTATSLWLQSIEADKASSDGKQAQCLRDAIKHMLDGAAEANRPGGSGTYRVLWQRQQVLVLLPVAS